MAVLPGYFEDAKKKAERASGVSPYSMPTGGDAGSAPAGGGAARPASASAPTAAPTKGSGSGFVNFGSYFGANAPAIQAQAEKTVGKPVTLQAQSEARGIPAQNALGGNANFRPGQSLSQLGKGMTSMDQGIARTQMQMAQVEPYTKAGSFGEGSKAPSLFDAMLGGGVTQRTAQSRFAELEKQLGSQQSEKTRIEAEARAAEAAAKAKAKEDAYAAWTADLPTQLRYNNTPEELRQMFEDEYAAGTWSQKTPAMVSTPASEL